MCLEIYIDLIIREASQTPVMQMSCQMLSPLVLFLKWNWCIGHPPPFDLLFFNFAQCTVKYVLWANFQFPWFNHVLSFLHTINACLPTDTSSAHDILILIVGCTCHDNAKKKSECHYMQSCTEILFVQWCFTCVWAEHLYLGNAPQKKESWSSSMYDHNKIALFGVFYHWPHIGNTEGTTTKQQQQRNWTMQHIVHGQCSL